MNDLNKNKYHWEQCNKDSWKHALFAAIGFLAVAFVAGTLLWAVVPK